MNISEEKLKELCDLFDKEEGEYPEHALEGISVYNFIMEHIEENVLEAQE
jgi:hypothetical protein